MVRINGNTNTRRVSLDGKELSPTRSQGIRNHSPDGFAWGYCGSGPAQLALAILLEVFPEDMAVEKYQDFKRDVLAKLRMEADFLIDVDFNREDGSWKAIAGVP